MKPRQGPYLPLEPFGGIQPPIGGQESHGGPVPARQEAFYCEQCRDIGLVPTEKGSRPCDCQSRRKREIRLERAAIPAQFAGAVLENFWPQPHNRWALSAANRFVTEFVPGAAQTMRGLLFTGSVGTGKTHLAVGILRALIEDKGIEGRFVTVPELLDKLRSSYDDAGPTQAQILKPILAADLVVIDELGAARSTEWVHDTIELLIGSLYNSRQAVIVTTNLPNLPAGAGEARNDYERAARPETLGDRIRPRMFSRLQQMCKTIEINGPDWRQKK